MRSPDRWLVAGWLGLAACGGGTTEPKVVAVASVSVHASTNSLPTGGTLQLGVTVRDGAGLPVSGRPISWATQHPQVAGVSSSGLVTGIAPGGATITATVDGVTGQVGLVVLGPPNLEITGVWLTQGTQRADGSIPLVIGGHPPLLHVLGSVQPAFSGPRPSIRVRVYEGGQLRFEDNQTMTGQPGSSANPATPVHQVVIPAEWVRPDLRVEVVANPDGAVPEERLDDNLWPAAGPPASIPVRSVAPLELHFVPVLLTVGGTSGIVTQASLQEYTHAVRQMFPVAQLSATIGTTFSTDVNFGGGEPAAWTQILPQLDALRVIEGTTRYYVGAIRPPNGVTFVQNGGWGYIPANPLASGPSTRSSLVVGVGWFSRASMTRELVAHELGHNHGRRHAPCGNPSGPDPLYPHAGGTIGAWGQDVYSHTAGLPGGLSVLSPTAGFDLMSYCIPAWTSDYTYEGLLNVRSAQVAVSPPVPCSCFVVWGNATAAGVSLEPAFETAAHVALGGGGSHRLEGLDAAGRVLFAEAFTPTEIDHAPGVRQFLLAIPTARAGGVPVAALRVVDGFGRVATAPMGTEASAPVVLRRVGAEQLELSWDASRTPALLVRDPMTGRVIGMGRTGRLALQTPAREVEVTASLGAAGASAVRLAVP